MLISNFTTLFDAYKDCVLAPLMPLLNGNAENNLMKSQCNLYPIFVLPYKGQNPSP